MRIGARTAWGVAAVAVYLVAAALTFRAGVLPVRPLYEGGAPQAPYRWVDPPPDFAPFNVPPAPGEGRVELTEEGSRGATVPTDDIQASVIVDPTDIAPAEGEQEVVISLEPVDPAGLGPPPRGHTYQSNAYNTGARYAGSDDPAVLVQPLTITMRFAVHATNLWRWGGQDAGWQPIESTPSAASFELFADVDELGTFVTTAAAPGGGRTGDIAIATGGAVVTVAGIALARLRARKRHAAQSRQVRRARQRGRKR